MIHSASLHCQLRNLWGVCITDGCAPVGKWHLGVGEGGRYLPYNRGFDHYYGVPYGIDMCAQATVMDVTRGGLPAGARPVLGAWGSFQGPS